MPLLCDQPTFISCMVNSGVGALAILWQPSSLNHYCQEHHLDSFYIQSMEFIETKFTQRIKKINKESYFYVM